MPNEKIDRSAVEQDYYSGMSYQDIASKYGVTINTVKSWKQRYSWDRKSAHTKEKVCTQKKSAIEELDNSDLTDKQKLFCIYYIKCFNATKAYQKAYESSYMVANAEGYKLLVNPRLRDEITRLKQNKLNQAFLAPEDIFQKYMDIAFSDITDFLTFGREEMQVMGSFGPLSIKDEDTGKEVPITKTVNSVRFRESSDIDGTLISEVKQGKDGASIKLHDRMKALQWLTDHMDMATEEQRARIAVYKAKAQGNETVTNTEDDGFLIALDGKASEAWANWPGDNEDGDGIDET